MNFAAPMTLGNMRKVGWAIKCLLFRKELPSREPASMTAKVVRGEDISLRKLLEAMGTISGREALRVPIPAGFAQVAAVIMELFADHVTHRLPEATVEEVQIAVRSKPLSIEKSRRELGYAPRPIEPALRDVIAWIPPCAQRR
jgi:dihydroflavonol-4-reductase